MATPIGEARRLKKEPKSCLHLTMRPPYCSSTTRVTCHTDAESRPATSRIRRAIGWSMSCGLLFPPHNAWAGTISADPADPMPCWGTTRTRSTDSWATANAWMPRHPPNSAVEVLHDPNGPRVKIARKSAWLDLSLDKHFGYAGLAGVGNNSCARRSECWRGCGHIHFLRQDYRVSVWLD
jgi:hypothetical protein